MIMAFQCPGGLIKQLGRAADLGTQPSSTWHSPSSRPMSNPEPPKWSPPTKFGGRTLENRPHRPSSAGVALPGLGYVPSNMAKLLGSAQRTWA
ncbi:hypothetical protein VP01_2122g3 [Puccinia sorghi]|uniref:Uncharacterized protein n=1 Tax=Puccinia sorghi TaxID=27349 RepID=A0A0L6V9Z4_9BASI|nr:hypothetical protein VP01_2122g3 [Puccinia sorghi]